ncbi:MAG: DUF5723 family protein [Odoribacteraceae bacterium]|jgi:hypothetical protein|nr:DUF5723 family protein [Odoribacteraceae bacterium]
MKTTTYLAVIALLVAPALAVAQATKTSYFMTSAHARHYLNPALYPDRGYIGVPLSGNIHAGAATNTFTLDNFVFLQGNDPASPAKNVTFLHKDVTPEQFLAGISDHNYLSASASVDLLSMGFRGKKAFWNVHVGTRVRADVDLPRSLFELLKVGFVDQDAPSTTYDLSGIQLSARAHVEVGLGYARSFIGGRLHAGVRPKLLLGVGEMHVAAEQLKVAAGQDFWQIQSRSSLAFSAPGITPKLKGETGALDGFDFDWNGIPGYGAALDLGASLRLIDLGPAGRLTVSAAANDIGFIKWAPTSTYRASTAGTTVTIRPNDYSVGQSGEDSSIEDILDDALDAIESGLDFFTDDQESGKSRSTSLNVSLNLGLEYSLFGDRFSVGALYSREQAAGYDMNTCTLSANLRPCSWFAASASYAVLTARPSKSVGFAMHISPRVGPALFIASDCAFSKLSKEFVPVGARDLNFQVGLTFNTGGGR